MLFGYTEVTQEDVAMAIMYFQDETGGFQASKSLQLACGERTLEASNKAHRCVCVGGGGVRLCLLGGRCSYFPVQCYFVSLRLTMPLYLVRENRVGSEEQTISNGIGGLSSESLLRFPSWPQETGKSGDEVLWGCCEDIILFW